MASKFCHHHCSCAASSIPNLGRLPNATSAKPTLKRQKTDSLTGQDCDAIDYCIPKNTGPRGKASVYGNVQHVIQGNTPSETLKRALDAGSFRYIFEAGTTAPVGDELGIGEMVAFNGKAYVRSTRIGTPEYYTTMSNTHVRSPAAFAIGPADASPDICAKTSHGGMTFTSAINDMFAEVNSTQKCPGVAFGGLVTFSKFVGVAVAKPTIYGENIFENKSTYFPYPPTELHGVRCMVFGVVADMALAEAEGIEKLDAVLYAGASGAGGSGQKATLTLHAHCVTLRDTCVAKTPQEIQPIDVIDCFHLDASSIVSSFELEVFTIKESCAVELGVEHSIDTCISEPIYGNCSAWNALADAGA